MLLFVLSRPFQITSVSPEDEPCPARTSVDPGYFDVPAELLDFRTPTEGRVNWDLRVAAQDRDGNKILRRVAGRVVENFLNPGSTSQTLITAMTQLAATGSAAFTKWSDNPTQEQDLTSYLTAEGMPSAAAATASHAIMSDFNAARQAVRNPGAGINETSLRQALKNGNWIAVSGEDDPPDFPVNVAIAPYPQYHAPITVPTPLGPNNSLSISIRYIIASSQDVDISSACMPRFKGVVDDQPYIPPGNEVIIYIHGEGSRAEEACDFIPALFSGGAAAGRSFTVISFDQPSTAYSTMVPHESVAPMPPDPGTVDTSAYPGSPMLDFVYNTIVTFVETVVLPFGNPITAVVGGSLGGHMALRLAASQKDWVRNVVAWSPACVWDHDFLLGFNILGNPVGVSLSQRLLADHVTWGLVTQNELDGSRAEFFSTVWDQPTFDPTKIDVFTIAGALLAAGVFSGPVALLAIGVIAAAILNLPAVPAQPLMWYRDDWPSGVPPVPLAPWGPSVSVGPAKAAYIQGARRDRREIYNMIQRQWHWRIGGEMIGFTFDALLPSINKPLLLMVGENDNYNEVHLFENVKRFAGSLSGLGKCVTVRDTGHSIHNERPYSLANQILSFASRP
jgi:pimeloyl-ACP methyl ester carboxylesterase